jgi:DNA-binding CsgD family transcriptional regulator
MAAASADPGGRMFDQVSEATRLLRDLVRCSAFMLSAWDPTSESHHHQTLASDGYSDATLSHVNDEYIRSRAFALAHEDNPRALRWRDYKRDWDFAFSETKTAQEFLIPAGFKEGSTMCLRLPDGRYTGAVHVSWSSAVAATDERREITERFRPILASVCDQLRTPQLLANAISPKAFALVLSSTGVAFELPASAPGPHLGVGGALRRLLLERANTRIPQRFVWSDEAGLCHRVALIPSRGNLTLVTEELARWPYNLSLREVQVLHLVADGASNPEIAEQLFIATRTVSTHIEHILAKMGCSSRAKLAAMAVSEGLLLVETPSRRKLGRA